jgi:hypothetical protein
MYGNNSFRGSDLRPPLTTGRSSGPSLASRSIVHSADAAPTSLIGRAHAKTLAANATATAARDRLRACEATLRAADEAVSSVTPADELAAVAALLAGSHIAKLEVTRAAEALAKAEAVARDCVEVTDGLMAEHTSLSRSRSDPHHYADRLAELCGGVER